MAKKRKTKRPKRKRAESIPEPPHVDADAFVAAQGVKPVFDMEKFREGAKGIWPEDESVDEFIAWRRSLGRISKA